MTSTASKSKVVIVGGNYLGSAAAIIFRGYKSLVDVTIVDQRDYWENSMASPKALVDGQRVAEVVALSHVDQYKDETFIQAAAVGVSDEGLLIRRNGVGEEETPEVVEYDYLIIATGASYALFKEHDILTRQERIDQYVEYSEKIEASHNIVFVGSGIVAIEFAGEIKAMYPEKTVTMVGSSTRPLEGVANDYIVGRVSDDLKAVGVNLIGGDRVDGAGEHVRGEHVVTKNGVDLGAVDLVISAVGGTKLNSEWMKGSILEDALDESGYVKITASSQVEGHPKVFAGGDVSTGPGGEILPARTAAYAREQGMWIANSIVKLIKKGPDTNLGTFSGTIISGFTIGHERALVFNARSKKWVPLGKIILWLKGGKNSTWMSDGRMIKTRYGLPL